MPSLPSLQKLGCNGKRTDHSPFKMPDDKDIFHFKKIEEAQKKKEFHHELTLPVHEKKTYSGRLKARQLELRKKLKEFLEEEDESTNQTQVESSLLQKTPECSFIMFRDRKIEKEGIHEFINKKRELFYLEYALTVKKEEIRQLEMIASCEEKKLAKAEKLLEDDIILFDEFLKENDKTSVEAIKTAEQETKAKLEKIAEIMKVTAQIVAIKSEISKYEDTLQEYKLYKDFLFKLSPPEWQEKQKGEIKSLAKTDTTCTIDKTECEVKRKELDKRKKPLHLDKGKHKVGRALSVFQALPPLRHHRASSRPSLKSTPQIDKIETHVDEADFEEMPELYFTDPQQLLDLLSELEEQNLSLIQNSQDAEEGLEELRKTMELTRTNMEEEANQLKQIIDIMTKDINKEKEKTAELKLKVKLFNFGQYKTEEESTLSALSKKVDEVYRGCIGQSEANLNTLQMLAAIESSLGELLDNMEKFPPQRLAMAMRIKEKERRIRLREEKLLLQKLHQERRFKKAMERAQAEIKRMCGKKLMPRSQPFVHKRKDNQEGDVTDKELEEYNYFFT